MNLSDVLIHVNEKLDDYAKNELELQLRNIEGVIAPRFSMEKDNFIFVSYNSDKVNATALIEKVRANGFQSQLIGI